MSDIDRILVPVDLERHTRKLVDFAVDMANKLDAMIILFHGIQSKEGGPMADMGQMALAGLTGEQSQSTHTDEAGKQLEEIASEI
ncbi:MAG TPA: universal stress protein, partial [Desulfopila sp.]|nr:universal stress protein [Desulfopila sp.]